MDVIVAQVVAAHGLKGEVVVDLHTDVPLQRLAVGETLLTDDQRELTVASSRPFKHRMLVGFNEITDRNQAEELRGLKLWTQVDLEQQAVEDPEGFYPSQLQGLAVVAPDGTALGEVSDLILGGAQDLLQVATSEGSVLVPFVKALVPTVDLEAQKIVVDPPGQMFANYPKES